MDDFSFWWYIIAAVIYFLTRSRKKKSTQRPSRPGSENNPEPQAPPKSFEDLLREITGEGQPEVPPPTVRELTPAEQEEEKRKEEEQRLRKEEESRRLEGERRVFADEESRRVYEESIKQAEGFDIEYGPDEKFKEPRLFRQHSQEEEEEEYTIADEIRDGLSSDEARKAIIYSEILNRRY